MESFKQEKIDALYHLIQSMSDHEVAKVTEYARIFDKNANQIHMQMFRFLRDATGYNHKELKAAFPGKQVSRIKNYLFRFIFRALAISGLQDHSELSWLIGETSIAMKKKHPLQALASINEAKEMAAEREVFLVHLEVLDWERKWVLEYEEPENKVARLEAIANEYEEVKIKKENLDHYFDLKVKYNLPIKAQALKTGQVESGRLDQLEEEEAMKSEGFPKSNRAQTERFTLWTLYYRGKGDFATALEYAEKEIGIFDQFEWFRQEEQEKYYNLLHRACLIATYIQKKDHASAHLTKLINAEDGTFNTALLLWSKSLIASSFYAIHFQDQPILKRTIKYFDQWHTQLDPHIKKKEKILVLFACLKAMMELGEYKKAKKIIVELIGLKDFKTKYEMQTAARIMHLVILFEENDEVGLESHGRNYQRYLKKLKDDQFIGFQIINCLRYSPKYKDRGNLQTKLEKLAAIIETKMNDPESRQLFNYYNFNKWLQGKLK